MDKSFLMAAIDTPVVRKKPGVKGLIKKTTRVDLTPMVDLGFLLITFFVFTTQLAKPVVTGWHEPKAGGEPSAVCESCALTLVPAADNRIYFYAGMPGTQTVVPFTSYDAAGLRSVLQAKKKEIAALNDSRKELILLVKPGNQSSLSNFVDVLDEAAISGIKKYFIAEPDAEDKKLLPGVWR